MQYNLLCIQMYLVLTIIQQITFEALLVNCCLVNSGHTITVGSPKQQAYCMKNTPLKLLSILYTILSGHEMLAMLQ